MSDAMQQADALLNGIAARIPMVEKSDLNALAAIMGDLEKLTLLVGLPKAFIETAKRATMLAELIIMGESEFDPGIKKLCSSIEKMQHSLSDIPLVNSKGTQEIEPESDDTKKAKAESTKKSKPNVSDLKSDEVVDLLIRFASNQQSVLEDFEAYILEMEKGNPQAKAAIKRILHTWKGEFGVLDLSEYSKLIHVLEENIENNLISADNLFRLKDLLTQNFRAAANGVMPSLNKSEANEILFIALLENAAPAVLADSAPREKPKIVATSIAPVELAPVPVLGNAAFTGDPSLMGDFVTESRDHIRTAESKLLELESDPSHAENLNSIFRAWHTIKGVAGFLGLKEVQSLAHSMENMMDMARKGDLVLTPGHIDTLLEANDCLRAFVDAIEKTMGGAEFEIPGGYAEIVAKLASPYAIAAESGVVPTLKKMGEILVEKGVCEQEKISEAVALQKEGDTRKLGEILIDPVGVPARAVANALASQNAARTPTLVEETIRVPINRIDQLVDAIGEAVIAQSMINADQSIMTMADQTLTTKVAHANMIMRQIQELAMSLRMVSVKATFQKMARLARDLSKKSGKEVDFITEGEDTELDKSVVENIGDPLIHMIRNSIDHGIESTEARAQTKKPAKARVVLRAYQKAGNIYMEIADDGKGLDKNAIFQKAVSRGLCKEDALLSDAELFQFIFLPGFSTAKQITDVSGRGVGMDVVKKNIEALRGSVEISSASGIGTTFTIRLPLTLAIVDGMIVRAGKFHYIVPTLAILESIKPAADQIDSVMQQGKMIKVRGELITLVHLEGLLEQKNGRKYEFNGGIVMIVEDMVGKKIGLYLDEIIGQQQVVIKSLGTGVGDVPGVSGGAIMSDGGVSLILDIGGVMKMANS